MANYVQLKGLPPESRPIVVHPDAIDALISGSEGEVTLYLRGGQTVAVEGALEHVARALSGRATLRHQRGADDS